MLAYTMSEKGNCDITDCLMLAYTMSEKGNCDIGCLVLAYTMSERISWNLIHSIKNAVWN